MIVVIFEVEFAEGKQPDYLDLAAELRPELAKIDGFVSVERFESLTTPGKLLSLSFWRDEAAVAAWRRHARHRAAQAAGRGRGDASAIFSDYRIRVAGVVRDYGMAERDQVPADLKAAHG
jgi:heme-degrading monooxygenase HmoA